MSVVGRLGFYAAYFGGAVLIAQTSGPNDPKIVSSARDAIPHDPTAASAGINSKLPFWLRFSGEERARLESIVGENFNRVNDLYLLNRLRLNMDVRPLPWLRFSFQAEDSRVFGQNTLPAPASQKESMDLRLGFVQVGSQEGPVSFRAGRQPLDFGEGRLVADPRWSNVGKSFDAARLSLKHSQLKLDLFSGIAVKVDPVSFDQDTRGEHFDGAYGSIGGLIPDSTIEPYVLWRLEHGYKSESGKIGNLDEKTFGFRLGGRLPLGFDYMTEVAGQRGSYAGNPIGAWLGHWVLGHALSSTVHRPNLFVELNRASGDANPNDGFHGTFDSLFPGSHDKYGLTDLICASNIVHFRLGFQYAVRPNLSIGAAFNDYWLASARDGLYIGGKLFTRSVNGAAGTHVGREADVQGQWTVSESTQLWVGYGRLFPGEFLTHTTSGVPYNLVFLGVGQRF